jgi:hypothetical protein
MLQVSQLDRFSLYLTHPASQRLINQVSVEYDASLGLKLLDDFFQIRPAARINEGTVTLVISHYA